MAFEDLQNYMVRLRPLSHALVFQPWVDQQLPGNGGSGAEKAHVSTSFRNDILDDLRDQIAETLLTGVRRADTDSLQAWRELAHRIESSGFYRTAAAVRQAADAISAKFDKTDWESHAACRSMLVLSLLVTLATDLR